MKKLLLIITLALLAFTLSAQKNTNYEYDDLYYQPSKDGKHRKRQDVDMIVDTLVKQNPKIIVNNYYSDDPFFYSNRIGRFYHGGFNYWMYQNPYYYYNDWFYGDYYYPYFGTYYSWNYPYYWHNDFYFGYNSYWGWNFGWNMYRPYYGHNYWYGQHNNYYTHNNYNGGGSFQQRPEYGRRERPSNYTQGNPPSNRRIESTQPQRNRIEAPQNKTLYGETRRSYQPTYDNPRMSTRPQYNNSRVGDMNKGRTMEGTNRSTEIRTESRTQTRTIMQSNPQRRSESQHYTAPTRSYSPAPNRSSEPQGFGRTMNFNSGGSDRRSSGSNFSSGSNSSSSGSAGNSGSSRSSGGSSSGRR